MPYQIIVSPVAQKQLAEVKDRRVRQALIQAIESLEENPEEKGKPLSGKLAGCFSVRAYAQRYRIIYRINVSSKKVIILVLGLRKEGDRADIYRLAERLIKAGLLLLMMFLCLVSDFP